MHESYITHLRVTEDAAHPSGPPPPDSPQQNKKPRIVIVAVKRSGRVRLHKSRENSDGSFSIGKTWMLDDLTRIQTFDHVPASSHAAQQQKLWASNVGFVVTITKPYYWQAITTKERDFFIGSLVKIYKKYTGGKVPELVGLDPRERDMLIGSGPPRGPPHAQPQRGVPEQAPGRPEAKMPHPSATSSHSNSPYNSRAPSRDGPREARRQPSREQFLQTKASHEQMQRPNAPFPSPKPSREALTPRAADTAPRPNPPMPAPIPAEAQSRKRADAFGPDMRPVKGDKQSPGLQSGGNVSPGYQGQAPTQRDEKSYFPEKSKAPPGPSPGRTPPSRQEGEEEASATRSAQPEPSPSLLRPTADSFGQKSGRSEAEEQFITPLTSPALAKVETPPPSRSGRAPDREGSQTSGQFHPPAKAADTASVSKPATPDSTKEPSKPAQDADVPRINIRDEIRSPTSPKEATESPPGSPQDKGDHRPGLGPMVKSKNSKDVASALRKAANAYGAFKPRAGGAAQRLMAAKEKGANEPDGITSVVPAPLLRGASNESKPTTADSAPQQTESPSPSIKESIKESVHESPKIQATEPTMARFTLESSTKEAPPKSKSAKPEDQQPPEEDNTEKYCDALGIDPTILAGRGMYFDSLLTDLGWNGRLDGDKRIGDLETEIRSEIGRVQASSWLGHLQSQAGNVDQLAAFFDRTTEQCDELDGLLTLYSYELSVSGLQSTRSLV